MSKDFAFSRKSTRLQNWNYGWEGLYFVTINTRFGENFFGDFIDNKIVLNDIGLEVSKQWLQTPSLRPDMNIQLDEFIVMPNHFHGIIGIGKNEFNRFLESSSTLGNINEKESQRQNSFSPQRKNLGSIMRGFKSSVTSWCIKNHKLFDWHTRYHDILIKDEKCLFKIRNYIRNNPINWHRDRFKIKT